MNAKEYVKENSTMAILLQLHEIKNLFHKNPVECRCELVTQDLSFRITKFIDSQVTYSITLFGIFYLLYKLFTNCWTMPEIILTLIAHKFTLIYMVTPPIYINLSYIFHIIICRLKMVYMYVYIRISTSVLSPFEKSAALHKHNNQKPHFLTRIEKKQH